MRRIFFSIFLFLLPLNSDATCWYGGFWGGAGWAHDRISDYDIDFDIGPAFGGVFGVRCPYDLRLELEGCYRQNPIRDVIVENFSSHMTGHHREYALFGNILYDLPLCSPFVPHIGLGFGWEREKTDFSFGPAKQEETDSGFTAQFIVGTLYHFCERLSFSVQYKQYLLDNDINSGAIGVGMLYWF